MRETQMRCPRMHGLPKQTSGLIEMRWSKSSGVMGATIGVDLRRLPARRPPLTMIPGQGQKAKRLRLDGALGRCLPARRSVS